MLLRYKKSKIIIIVIVVISIISFWFLGLIPSYIARTSAENYVEAKYKDRGFEFLEVYWDSNWGRYFVSFIDKNGKNYSFKMSGYIPVTIMYDPLDPPG